MSDPRQFDAVLFDAFGTLIDLDDPVPRLHGAFMALGETYPLEEVAHAFGREVAFYRTHQHEGHDPATLATLRRRCAQVLCDALGSGSPVESIEQALMSSLHFHLFDDVVPALGTLHDAGYRLGVVSNWDAGLPDILAGLGVAHRLEVVSVSAIVGARKPDPRIFMDAVTRLGVSPDRVIHVGDRVDTDISGARSAGLQALLIRRPPTGREDVALLTDLPDVLARWPPAG